MNLVDKVMKGFPALSAAGRRAKLDTMSIT